MVEAFKFTEVPGDIFDYEPCYRLTHCISSDFCGFRSRLSVQINNKYNIYEELKKSYPREAWRGRGYCIYCAGIFNLVARFRANEVMRSDRLREALEDMRDQMIKYEIKKAVLPRIEEGDVVWNDGSDDCIHNLITLVFAGTDLEIKVVYPPQTKEDLSIIDPDLERIHFGENRKHIDGNTERKYY